VGRGGVGGGPKGRAGGEPFDRDAIRVGVGAGGPNGVEPRFLDEEDVGRAALEEGVRAFVTPSHVDGDNCKGPWRHLSLIHDLVDTSSRSGGGGGTVAASGVCGDESLAGARGKGGIAERHDGGRWFRSLDNGVLVLRVFVPGGVGIPVKFPEGASGVKGVVAAGRLFTSILAVRTYADALAHAPFVGGSGRALLLMLVVGVATTTPAAAGEFGVASGAERHIMAKFVAAVAYMAGSQDFGSGGISSLVTKVACDVK
jgi:hypothetical protein